MATTPPPSPELAPARLEGPCPKRAGPGTLLAAICLFALIVTTVERALLGLGCPVLITTLAQEGLLAGAALWFAKRDGLTAADMGFSGSWTWIEGVYIPAQFFGHWILSGLYSAVIVLAGIPLGLPAAEVSPDDMAWLTGTFPVALLSVAGLAVAAGVCEEVAFRGYLVPRLMRSGVSAEWAAVISGSLFALAHVPGYGLLASLPKALFFGIPMAYYVARRRNLWTVILVHILIDLFALGTVVLIVNLLPKFLPGL